MSQDFRPGTRSLLRAVGWEGKRHYKSPHDENYLLHEIVVHLGNRAFAEMGPRYRYGAWSLNPELVAAAREALPENGDNYAAQDLAYLLARAGATGEEVLAHLHPWDRLAFRWREAGLSAAQIAAILQPIGVCDGFSAEQLRTVDDWIAQPITALSGWVEILDTLFGLNRHAIPASVREKAGGPSHAGLLQKLLARARPPITIDVLSEEWHDDLIEINLTGPAYVSQGNGEFKTQEVFIKYRDQGHGAVHFCHDGKPSGFMFNNNCSSWMDTAPVVDAVDRLLADLARSERVFLFATPRGESGEFRFFILADQDRFRHAAERLALPLEVPRWR